MKKKIGLILALLVSLAMMSIASASVPGSGWWHGQTYQNIGTAPATIMVNAYQSGSTAPVVQHTISNVAVGGAKTILPDTITGLPAGFTGSVVASSDQPMAAIVTVTNRQAGNYGVSGGKAAALYSGITGGDIATTVAFPLVKHNHAGKTTTFYLQNAGSAAAVMNVTFSVNGSNYTYTSPSVAAGRMVAVEPALASVPAGNGNVGAMIVTSAEPIAAVMIEHEHSASTAKVIQGSAGFTAAQLDTTSYCPLYKKNFGKRNGGLQVQNAHTASQIINVDFISTTGAVTTVTTANLAPGASQTFFGPNVPQIADGKYSVKITGQSGNVAAIVNEAEFPLVSANQTATTYACVANSRATTDLSYPGFKNRWAGRSHGFQIQNVGSSAASVTLTLTSNTGSTHTSSPQSIPAGASITVLNPSDNAAFWSGSALPNNSISGVTVSSTQPIIAVANEASWSSGGAPDNGSSSFDKANAVAANQ